MKHTLDLPSKTLTVIVPGDILSTNADLLRKEIFGLLESELVARADWNRCKLDLRAAKMIDSVGLNLLVSLIKQLKIRNATIVAEITSTSVQRALLFTRLNTQMEVQLAA